MKKQTVIDNRFLISDDYEEVYITSSFRRYFPLAFDYSKKTNQSVVKVNRCVFKFEDGEIVRFFGSFKDFQENPFGSKYYYKTI